jgi:hypothetical protein
MAYVVRAHPYRHATAGEGDENTTEIQTRWITMSGRASAIVLLSSRAKPDEVSRSSTRDAPGRCHLCWRCGVSLADAGPDPEYVNAAMTAARLGMPAGTLWAAVVTVTEIRKTADHVPVRVKLATLPETGLFLPLLVPYSALRWAEGFAIKLFGACVQAETPTTWALGLPAELQGRKLGGHIVIEPWLTEIPIRVPEPPGAGPAAPGDPLVAVALRQRWPDRQVKKWVHYLDDISRLDDALKNRALAALDLRVRTGRPSGSGKYRSAPELRAVIDPLVRALRASGRHPSVDRVAERMPGQPDPKLLSRWVHRLLMVDWNTYLDTVV